MRQRDRWRPSKYVMRKGELRPNSDHSELAVSSRLIARLITSKYQPAIRQYAHGLLLDLGCGKVPFYEAYREYVAESICADWPSSTHGAEHVDAFCDLSLSLPFANGSFDTILSSDVIEHLPDPQLAFAEMGRLLKPGGVLLLNTPFLYMLHEIPYDYYRFTRYAIHRLLEANGMEIIQLEELGGAGAVIVDLASKAFASLPIVGALLSSAAQALGVALVKAPQSGTPRAPSLMRFPIGYFLVARKHGCVSGPSPQ